MGKKSVKQPDLQPYADAMMDQGRYGYLTSQEQLGWAREQDGLNRQLLERVLGPQLAAQENQAQWAQEDRARYEGMYQPLEDDLVKDFQSYGTPERMQAERGRAMADVGGAFDAQRKNALQRLESYGVDPSQTRNAALDVGMRTAQAAATAAAGTNAQRVTEDKARALRADAINIGRGLPSQVAQSYGQSVAAGSAAMGGANSTFQTGAGAMGNPTAWGQMGQAGYMGAGNMMNQQFQNNMANAQYGQAGMNSLMGGLGAAGGMALSLADGGQPRQAIPYGGGGPVAGPSDGSGIDDQVPAKLSAGEYVIPADVVNKKGSEFFDKIVQKYHTPAAQQRQQALPTGAWA